ncbi:hypothetical protein N7468_009173 [Penicillium chermesinum]|uniref:2EXR domain-containing protein n=1 Tax=Penicillium chermesinum TaxID=63820 RepID=A0A9W9NJS1_9EURO|nr:uncharacterized protein N7468_009173 [Penicillium chermesinum]KAJ5219969.1 hypothetical protein N7468_009173 [Penicillium chermesinum]
MAERQTTGASFHLFPRLPAEIRLIIWEYCLPNRVAEVDDVFFILDGRENRQGCYAQSTTARNAQPPVLASVNAEARSITFQQGFKFHQQEPHTCLKSVWVQPRRDIMHLNWTSSYFRLLPHPVPWEKTVEHFLRRAEALKTQGSILADVIYPFYLRLRADGLDGTEVAPMPGLDDDYFRLGNFEVRGIVRHLRLRWNDIRTANGMVRWGIPLKARDPSEKISIHVVMAAVSLHITKEVARESGMFGLLGDAPVQMIKVGDTDRLSRFETLYRQNTSGCDTEVQYLFDTFASARFQRDVQDWKTEAESVILLHLWSFEREMKHELLGEDPGSAWIPNLTEEMEFGIEIDAVPPVPDEDHPWVKHARKSIPDLQPHITVRCCFNGCFNITWLPDGPPTGRP